MGEMLSNAKRFDPGHELVGSFTTRLEVARGQRQEDRKPSLRYMDSERKLETKAKQVKVFQDQLVEQQAAIDKTPKALESHEAQLAACRGSVAQAKAAVASAGPDDPEPEENTDPKCHIVKRSRYAPGIGTV